MRTRRGSVYEGKFENRLLGPTGKAISLGCASPRMFTSNPPAVHLPFALLCMYQHRLKRRPLPSMLLKVRFCVDSIPSALTIF